MSFFELTTMLVSGWLSLPIFWFVVFPALFIMGVFIIDTENESSIEWSIWPLVWVIFPVAIWVSKVNPFVWAYENSSLVFSAAFQYFLIGGAYMVGRWAIFTNDKAKYLVKNMVDLEKLYKNTIRYENIHFEDFLVRENYIPWAKKNKYRLLIWGLYWPFSFVNWIFSDFLRKMSDLLILFFGGFFDKIRDIMFNRHGATDVVIKAGDELSIWRREEEKLRLEAHQKAADQKAKGLNIKKVEESST